MLKLKKNLFRGLYFAGFGALALLGLGLAITTSIILANSLGLIALPAAIVTTLGIATLVAFPPAALTVIAVVGLVLCLTALAFIARNIFLVNKKNKTPEQGEPKSALIYQILPRNPRASTTNFSPPIKPTTAVTATSSTTQPKQQLQNNGTPPLARPPVSEPQETKSPLYFNPNDNTIYTDEAMKTPLAADMHAQIIGKIPLNNIPYVAISFATHVGLITAENTVISCKDAGFEDWVSLLCTDPRTTEDDNAFADYKKNGDVCAFRAAIGGDEGRRPSKITTLLIPSIISTIESYTEAKENAHIDLNELGESQKQQSDITVAY